MKIDVSEYEKKHTFGLERITQLCGQNIRKKSYILESLRKYFSTYKYNEEYNKWRNNVKIDNEIVGRKFFKLISISGISEILSLIKLSKQSLMTEYIKQLMQKFDYQNHLHIINEELEKIFQTMNNEIQDIGSVELTYTETNIWDMIQKSSITGSNETLLEDKDNYEILLIFLNLIEEIIKINPEKMMIVLENIDHLITCEQYKNILDRLKKIVMKYDIYFILSTSMDGYVICDKELCQGITILNDIDFQMPEFDKVAQYVNYNYPYDKNLSEKKITKRFRKNYP